jgi:hypothetical protein
VAYFSRKLTAAQKKYTTLEKELLSIFMVFKEFDTMLLGATIRIHTDHKNLTYTTSINDCVLRQLNYIEQFSPSFTHISGDNNFLADMFSRLPRLDDSIPDTPSNSTVKNYSFILDDEELLECFLNLPAADHLPFALDLERRSRTEPRCRPMATPHAKPVTLPRTAIWRHSSAFLQTNSNIRVENMHPHSTVTGASGMVPLSPEPLWLALATQYH